MLKQTLKVRENNFKLLAQHAYVLQNVELNSKDTL